MKKAFIAFIILTTLLIPTSAFATYQDSQQQNGLFSFFDNLFSNKNQPSYPENNSESQYMKALQESNKNNEYIMIDNVKVKLSVWLDFLNCKNPPSDIESNDIWKNWYNFKIDLGVFLGTKDWDQDDNKWGNSWNDFC